MPFGIIFGQLKDVVRARGYLPDLVGVSGGRGGEVARLRAMRRYSFEAVVGRPVRDFGSDFILSPLTDPGGRARAACFHLAAGGSVGEHEATVGQLFCVVAGEGWVSGPDGVRHPIAPFQAAYWEAGERHATGTAAGLVAVVLEGDDFEVWAREHSADAATGGY